MKTALALGIALTALHTGWAGPIQRGQIAADATWFVHLDADRLRKTQVGEYLMTELTKGEADAKLNALQALLNCDLRKKLKSCTLYSRGSTAEDAVLLLDGDFDRERLVVLVKAAKEYQSAQHRSYTIHEWLDEGRKAKIGGNPHSFGAIHSSGIVLLGQQSKRIGEALDVLDKAQPGLANSGLFPEAGAAATASSVILGATRQTDLGQFAPNVAFLKHFKLITLSGGETDSTVSLALNVEAENEDAAKNLLAMAQGALAWGAFQGDKAGSNKLLQGLNTSQKGAAVSLSLKLPASDVVQMLKDGAARRGGKPR